MKKIIILIVLLSTLAMSGCGTVIDTIMTCMMPAPKDYSYKIGTGYQLVRSSVHSISVSSIENGNKTHIDAKVVEVAWDDRYVLAKQVGLKFQQPDNPNNTYKIPDENQVAYYILDTIDDVLYGGYSFEEFIREREALGVPDALVLKDVESYK